MSMPSIEEEYANYIFELKAEYFDHHGFYPPDRDLEAMIDEGDFRRGEE
jgi:hypothetical protein